MDPEAGEPEARDSEAGNAQDQAGIPGVVEEALANAIFRVRLPDGRLVLAYQALPACAADIHPGDIVMVELLPHDPARGRVVAQLRRQRDGS